MSAVARSPERVSAWPVDRTEAVANQRRLDEAFRLLGLAAARIVTDPNPTAFVLDLASRDGALQDVWCRDGASAAPLTGPAPVDPAVISAGAYGPVNAERYVRAQKALSALLLELARPDCSGAATLRLRGVAGEIGDDISGESRRQWRF